MSTSERSAGIRDFADRWPFRRKLNVLVGVPLAVVALLLAYLITDQVGQAREAASAAQLVRDSAQVAKLVDLVESEHQQAILLSVRYEAGTDDSTPSQDPYRTAQVAVNAQIEKVRATFGDRLPDTEAQALRQVSGLSSLRDTVEQSYLPANNIDPAYTGAAEGLIDGLGLDRNPALAATFTGNLLDSLLRADAAHSSFETNVFSATTGDTNAPVEFTGAVGMYQLYAHQAARFGRFATEEQADELSGIEHTRAQGAIAEAYAELQVDPSALQKGDPAEVRRAFRDALDDYPDYPAQAAARLKITGSLIGQIADRADHASNEAWWRAALLLALFLLGFALWLAFSVLVRRSVVRPVVALTGAAQEVADVAGRELARVADDDAEEAGPPRLRKIPATARDEIGELAEVFNRVQTTAVALLERQVLSRRNVAEMFGNVGRRVSNLTSRQLALIDAVERGETDPALLERLYSIDHIAVRLRRNADSLMLLAGIRETVLDSGPTALTNVVRAALGQIEGYRRVRLRTGTDIMVEPDIIGDLTLMVAELLENAVSFSPAGSPVEVVVEYGDEGASITVADHGLGMSTERLAEENARLIRRERLDLVPTKVLGLFVVGTLARRWEVGVTLSRTPGGGVTAEVRIPSTLLLTMSAVASGGSAGSGSSAGYGAEVGAGAGGASADVTVAAGAARSGPGAAQAASAVPGSGEADVNSSSATGSSGGALLAVAPGTPSGNGSGPRPSAAVPPQGASADDRPGPLPRRVPRWAEASTESGTPSPSEAGAEVSASLLSPSGKPTSGSTSSGERTPTPPDDTPGPRPLRRRVRGATLPSTVGAAQQLAHQDARPADADAVRLAIEEFEAAVERAHRDTATAHPDTASAAPRAAAATAPHDTTDPRTPRRARDSQDQNHLPEGAEQ